jgi:hypothetical protein
MMHEYIEKKKIGRPPSPAAKRLLERMEELHRWTYVKKILLLTNLTENRIYATTFR